MDEVKEKLERAGFNVMDEVEIGDLSDVREEKGVLPPAKAVKLAIRKATNQQNDKGTFRQLNMSMELVDGIEVSGEVKFKGKVIWARIPYYADSIAYNSDYFKKKQHLVEFKKLALALGKDITAIKVNDDFLAELTGKVITADIWQKTEKYVIRSGKRITVNKKSPANEGEEVYSEPVNEVSNFKAVSTEGQV